MNFTRPAAVIGTLIVALFAQQSHSDDSLCRLAIDRMTSDKEFPGTPRFPFYGTWKIDDSDHIVISRMPKGLSLSTEKKKDGGEIKKIREIIRLKGDRPIDRRASSEEEVSIETGPSGRVSAISYSLFDRQVDNKKNLEWVPDEYTQGRLVFSSFGGKCVPNELYDAQVGVVWSIPVCVDLINTGAFASNDIATPGSLPKACNVKKTKDFSSDAHDLKKIANILDKHDIRARDGRNSKYNDILLETKQWDMPPDGAVFVPLTCLRAKQIFYGCSKFAPETLRMNLENKGSNAGGTTIVR